MAALFKPYDLEYMTAIPVFGTEISLAWLDPLLIGMNFVILFYIVLVIFLRRYTISKMTLLLILLAFAILISAFMHDNSLFPFIKMYGPAINLFLLVDLCVQNRSLHTLLKAMCILLTLWISINVITMILYPDGLFAVSKGFYMSSENWFLGWQKRIGPYYFPALLSVILYAYYKHNRITIWVYFIVGMLIFTCIRVWAVAVLVCFVVFLLLLLVAKIPVMNKFLNPIMLTAVVYVWFVAIILLRLQNHFSYFIVDVFDKDLTFSGRTYVWDEALETIEQNFFWGIGQLKTFTLGRSVFDSAHSAYLDMLIHGGIVAFILFAVMQVTFIFRVRHYQNDKYGKIISFMAFIFFFQMVSDPANPVSYYIPMILGMYIPQLKNEAANAQCQNKIDFIKPEHGFIDRRNRRKTFDF
jgi:O-antigen ligase